MNEQKIKDSHERGYGVGQTWKDDYIPGGPYVYSGRNNPQMVEQDKAEHKAYMEGFREGLRHNLLPSASEVLRKMNGIR